MKQRAHTETTGAAAPVFSGLPANYTPIITPLSEHPRSCRCENCERRRAAAWDTDKAAVASAPDAPRRPSSSAALHGGATPATAVVGPRHHAGRFADYCSLCGLSTRHWLGCDGTADRVGGI